jgi:hypothetical protein
MGVITPPPPVVGSFTSVSEVLIDATTSLTAGPTATSISAQSSITINFGGYGVALIKLQ